MVYWKVLIIQCLYLILLSFYYCNYCGFQKVQFYIKSAHKFAYLFTYVYFAEKKMQINNQP